MYRTHGKSWDQKLPISPVSWISESSTVVTCIDLCYKYLRFRLTTNHLHLNVHPNSQEQISDESQDSSEDSFGAEVPSLLQYRILIQSLLGTGMSMVLRINGL